MTNVVNYWIRRRSWFPFGSPADVVRSIEMAPGTAGSAASWAGVVAAAVAPVAAGDLDAAIDLAGWPVDPGERLIACAALVAGLTNAEDTRAADAMAALGRTAVRLPRYVPEVDMTKIDHGPMLTYLDPSARARWEAALLLPPKEGDLAEALVAAIGSWFLSATLRAERFQTTLYEPVPENAVAAAVVEGVRGVLTSADRTPDPIQVELVRLAAVWALAPWDAGEAARVASTIGNPGRALLARLFAAVRAPTSQQVSDVVQAVLDTAPPDLPALDRAIALAFAAQWTSDTARDELIDRAAACLGEADAMSAAVGLVLLAEAADPPRRADLTVAAMRRAEEIGNVYNRSTMLSEMLRPALLSGDVDLVVGTARRLLDADWQVLMEGLQRAAGPLVEFAGAGVIGELDRAFRAAQAIVGRVDDGAHLDGVAAADFRVPALAAPAQEPGPGKVPDPGVVYLDGADLPGMSLVQDSAESKLDPGDYAFAACDGISSGLRVWMAARSEQIWRLVDIRWVFPDANRAARVSR